jgi:alpha-tubulin suppressor-like RCC1 family protein
MLQRAAASARPSAMLASAAVRRALSASVIAAPLALRCHSYVCPAAASARSLHSVAAVASVPLTTRAQDGGSHNSSSSRSGAWPMASAAAFALLTASATTLLLGRNDGNAHAEAAAAGGFAQRPNSAGAPGRSVYAVGGNNLYGTLGLGDLVNRAAPEIISTLSQAGTPIVQLIAAGNHAAALGQDGRLWTWGSAVAGVLGHETGNTRSGIGGAAVSGTCTVPQPVEALAGRHIVRVALSETHAAAVEQLPDGSTQLWTWGTRALLGSGDDLSNDAEQMQVQQQRQFADRESMIKAKGRGSVDIRSADQLEQGNPSLALLPQLVPSLSGTRLVDVACGAAHTLALTSDGQVLSWGLDRDGALGTGDRLPRLTPTAVTGLPLETYGPVVSVAAGNGSSFFVTASGTLLACGANDRGQAGTGSTQRRYLTPVVVSSLRDVAAVSAGAFHALALDKHGQVFSFGLNQSGQLGQANRNIEQRQPQQLVGALDGSPVVQIDGGFAHSGCVTQQHRLFLFGRGREGQLGRGDQLESIAATRDAPVEVAYFSKRGLHVLQVATGADFTLALVEEDARAVAEAERKMQQQSHTQRR